MTACVFDRLPRLPLLALAAAFLIGCPAGAQAEPQSTPPQADAQPEAHATAPDSGPAGAEQTPAEQKPQDTQDTKGEPAKEQSEPGAASQEPASKIVINIDKSKQEMTVFVDGVEQYSLAGFDG